MRASVAASVSATALLLTGCAATAGASDPTVVTSLYPLQYVAERVAGDHLEVVNVVPPGVEPHDLELTVEQTARLADAAVVVHLSGFQPAVDEAVEQEDPDVVLDVAGAADLRPAGETDAEHEEHGEHDHGDADPHFWLDPTRLADVAVAVEEALAEAHPDHAEDFAAGREALVEELEALDEEYRAGLTGCRTSTVVVSHDAFGYLARYGLAFAPIAGLSPDAEPSPAHLAELQRLAEQDGVTTVFAETLGTSELADTLAAELGVATAVLDPLEGLAGETEGEDYLSLMRRNLEVLREANGCR